MTPGPRARLARSGFARNASVMIVGTALGQVASVALAPVLTRLYTPAEFGYLSVYTAALAIFGVTAALGFDLALPLAVTDAELANLIAAAGCALAVTTGVVALGMGLLPGSVLASLWLAPLEQHRYLVPLGFVCLGGYYIMVAAATRAGRFADIARTRISQGLAGPLSQIALGLLGTGAQGLTIGFIVGQSSGTMLLVSRLLPPLRRVMSWRGTMGVVRRYSHFPLFASWTRVIDMAGSGTVLYLLFSTYYSSEIVGFMFLGERVIARPLLMVSSSLQQVFSGEAGQAARHDPNALARRFRQVVPGQLIFALAWIVPVNLLAGLGRSTAVRRAVERGGSLPARTQSGLRGARGAASGRLDPAIAGASGRGGGVADAASGGADRGHGGGLAFRAARGRGVVDWLRGAGAGLHGHACDDGALYSPPCDRAAGGRVRRDAGGAASGDTMKAETLRFWPGSSTVPPLCRLA